jgi:hypothetical protein
VTEGFAEKLMQKFRAVETSECPVASLPEAKSGLADGCYAALA